MNTHRRNQLPSHVASHYAIAPSYEPEPPRKKKGGSVLSNILLVVGLALILVAGGMWGLAQWRYHDARVSLAGR